MCFHRAFGAGCSGWHTEFFRQAGLLAGALPPVPVADSALLPSNLSGLLIGAGHVLSLDSNTTDEFGVGQTLKFQKNSCSGRPSAGHSWGCVPFAVASSALLLLASGATALLQAGHWSASLSGSASMPGALCSLFMPLLSDWGPPTSISAQKVGHMSCMPTQGVLAEAEALQSADASAA